MGIMVKKKLNFPQRRLFVITVSIVMAIFVVRNYLQTQDKSIEIKMQEKTEADDSFFLKNIDLSDGDYALIIKNHGKNIVIDNSQLLAEYTGKIQVERSWMSFIPGEGGHQQTLTLFKNRQLLKEVIYKKASIFKTGNIEQYGKPVKHVFTSLPREDFLKYKQTAMQDPTIYVYDTEELRDAGHEYYFSVELPTFFIKAGSYFDREQYKIELQNRIEEDIKSDGDFTLSVHERRYHKNESGESRLHSENIYTVIKDKNNHDMYLKGLQLNGYRLAFTVANEDVYNTLKEHDFKQYMKKGVSRLEFIARVDEQLSVSNKEFIGTPIFIDGYREDILFSELKEYRYGISYYKAEN
jgi:hypothetical protein